MWRTNQEESASTIAPITPPAPHRSTRNFEALLSSGFFRRVSASSAKKRLCSGGFIFPFASAGSKSQDCGASAFSPLPGEFGPAIASTGFGAGSGGAIGFGAGVAANGLEPASLSQLVG
jgi:hypothetical protein